MPLALETVVKQLEDSGIVSSGKLENFIPPKASPKDAEELLRELHKQKLLTKFQAQQVAAGKAKALILGGYTILDKIGAGGMGQVFKAEHRRMKRIVAIKMLPAAMLKDAAAAARFQREVEAAAKLEHTNIVTAHDADEANGVHFLVMQYVEGSDLSALVKKDGPVSVEKAVNYILQAARGLEFAHKRGVIHRDIKPANLLLDSEGTVKILDMGLARIESNGNAATQAELTGTGAVMGTVDYMAPEQARSTHHADARADIYSLGCSLFYLLTAKPLYGGETITNKLISHQFDPIPSFGEVRDDVPEQVEAVYQKMVAKKVEERYQSMSEVIADLQPLVAGGSTMMSSMTGSTNAAPSNSNLTFLKEAAGQTVHRKTTKQIKQPKADSGDGKQPPSKSTKVLIGAGAAGLALLLGVILIVRDKDDKEVARIDAVDGTKVTLPAGGSVQVQQSGSTADPKAKSESQPVDLLKLIDLKRDVVSGEWKIEQGALVTPMDTRVNIPVGNNNQLLIPFRATNSYQLTAVAQRQSQTEGPLFFGISIEGQQVTAGLALGTGHLGVGLDIVNGLNGSSSRNPTNKNGTTFKDELPHTIVIIVRGPGVQIMFDGKTMMDYQGGSSLSFNPMFSANRLSPNQLFLGSRASYRITKLEYLPLDEAKASATSSAKPPTPPAPLGPTPPLAKAPFNAAQAKLHQAAWAKYLGIEIETPNSVGMTMVLIPPGEFMMGSTDEQVEAALKMADEIKGDQGVKDRIEKAERPQHKVVITRPLLMSATEVTVGQFKKFAAAMGYQTEAEKAEAAAKASPPTDEAGQPPPNPIQTYLKPGNVVSDDLPAVFITWKDATAYCKWLSEREKTTYRLPTEAEWEYACRAGTTTQYSFGDDYNDLPKYGWHNENVGGKSHPVGTLLPNPFGLLDMHGNLSEWCGDYFDEKWYSTSPPNDPNGPSVGSTRVLRGGHWFHCASYCRSAARNANTTLSYRSYNVGFRCVLELSVSTTASATPANPSSKLFMHDPGFPQWLKDVQALPAEQQIEAVSKKLVELNPGFDGVLRSFDRKGPPLIQDGIVTSLGFIGMNVVDLSPVRALSGLKNLECGSGTGEVGKLIDLSPLRGLQLSMLACSGTGVADISPLSEMKLKQLYCAGTQVSDLSPVHISELQILRFTGTRVTKLPPLGGSQLYSVACDRTPIVDFAPLLDCKRLATLDLRGTTVTPASVAALQKALPNCKIEWDDPTKATTPQPAPSSKLFLHDPAFPQWMAQVQAMPAQEQIIAVSKKLMELNPGFDGLMTGFDGQGTPKIEKGAVRELGFINRHVTNLSPIRALANLDALRCGGDVQRAPLSDLSPLKGTHITKLVCNFSAVSDLSPLKGMPLTYLDCIGTDVSDLTPLQGMRLTTFWCSSTKVSDLSPLAGMPLTMFSCHTTPVADISPLRTCKSLLGLNITSGTRITKDQVAALQQALPSCRIRWNDPTKVPATTTTPPAPSSTKLFMHDPAFPQWMAQVQAMPAQEQIKAVSKKLVELNPGFDGKVEDWGRQGPPRIQSGVVREFGFATDKVTDISPLRALEGLKYVSCVGVPTSQGKLSDLSPLQGISLIGLRCDYTNVSDLSPLTGMPLGYLACSSTLVSDLTPLKGKPLTTLYCQHNQVDDLSPLVDCKSLIALHIKDAKVTPAGIASLQKALPNCQITWDDPAKATTQQPAASGTK